MLGDPIMRQRRSRSIMVMFALSVVVTAVVTVIGAEKAFAANGCTHTAWVPWGSVTAGGEVSCNLVRERNVGAQLREDRQWRPDQVYGTSAWNGTSNFHTRSIHVPLCFDTTSRDFFSKVFARTAGFNDYHDNDSARFRAQYKFC